MRVKIKLVGVAVALGCAGIAIAEAPEWMPDFRDDGTVHVPAFELPPSDFISDEARTLQQSRATVTVPTSATASTDIAARRRGAEAFFGPQVVEMLKRYPAEIVEQKMAGVRTRVVTPIGVDVDPDRVLINLHGGGFNTCAEACGAMESIPVAALARMQVITVDYRQAPEHVFPAASEDVAAVYGELLKKHKPRQIGIYGCSAGGSLSAQVAAWLPAHGMPQVGAIGIFGAGGVRFGAGDSAYIAPHVDGSFPPPSARGKEAIRSYFEGADMDSAMVSPALHPEVAAKFPPTLIITGTRAIDLSPAVVTNSKLVDAGVETQLIVGEGMGHCYIYQPQLPETQAAYRAIAKFFRTHLE